MTASVDTWMREAVWHHQFNRLAQAEVLYNRVLAVMPNQPDALHNLGLIALAVGQAASAAGLFARATRLRPNEPIWRYNLGVALELTGDANGAIEQFKRTIKLKPDYIEALNNLGNLWQKSGKNEEAVNCFRRALSVKPDTPIVWSNLGNAYKSLGDFEEAKNCYRKATALNPDYAEAWANLGKTLKEQGEIIEATDCFRRSLAANPDLADTYFNLGVVLQEQGQLDLALDSYRDAVRIEPNHVGAHGNLGEVAFALGRHKESIESFSAAVALENEKASFFNSLGLSHFALRELGPAEFNYKRAIELAPDEATYCSNYGVVCAALGRHEEAESWFKVAIAKNPSACDAYNNLANMQKDAGLFEEAIKNYRKVLSIRPTFALAYSNLLFTMLYTPAISPEEHFQELLGYARAIEEPLKALWPVHANLRDPAKRIKLGYVSGDFRYHSVAYFIEPVLVAHDHQQFEIYCYSNNAQVDEVTRRLRPCADHWVECYQLSDKALADRIMADGIDVLIDLSGHTSDNRLPVFARKPAPVQISWIGFAASTGLSAMDYRISDSVCDPPGMTEHINSEKILRLPDTVSAFQPDGSAPLVNPLPSLGREIFTFASLNNLTKINEKVVALWSKILHSIPGSRLMLGNAATGAVETRVVNLFASFGIGLDRLSLLPRMIVSEYLRSHHEIDLALDPFPYNGGTTTFHSLLMGVPVITLEGRSHISRSGAGTLARFGLFDFIAKTEEEYLEKAIFWSKNRVVLNEIRQSLPEKFYDAESKIGSVGFTRTFENAVRKVWVDWCNLS